MASLPRLSLFLLTSCAGLALAACDGATSVASPGEGTIVLPAPTPSPSASPSPTPTAGVPALTCPTGTTSVGTIGGYRSCRLPTLITTALTLPKLPGTAYEINGRVDVGVDVGGAGTAVGGTAATLTIEAGVLIYANTTNADNDFLIVNRGSRILATGTETSPIIFTSQENILGTVTDASQGLWGGVIMAGRAPVSNCNLSGVTNDAAGSNAACENIVEGTGNALYGGSAAGDNSGVFRYVQIRYSGTIISPNNELQGLTLGGVGSGTTIDHVQIHNSSDDGIEIFGGTSNLRHLVITGADDDGLDTDVGWRGFVQFALVLQKPGSTTSDSYSTEIDSNSSEDALPRQFGRLANFTFLHTSTGVNAAIRLRGGADYTMVNGIVVSPQACLNVIAGADAGGKTTIRPANSALQDVGPPVFNSIYFACAALSTETAVNSITVTNAEQAALVSAGTNNTANGTAANALSGYMPTATTAAVPAFNAATLNPAGGSFFINTSYIGAISGASDTWYKGWTCNSNRGDFGTTSAACTAVPTS
jgi:hypothetical protein